MSQQHVSKKIQASVGDCLKIMQMQLDFRLTICLRLIHRIISFAKKVFGLIPLRVSYRQTNTCGDMNVNAIYLIKFSDPFENKVCTVDHNLSGKRIFDKNTKLISTQPGNRILRTYNGEHSFRDFHEQTIPYSMAKSIIHGFEIIQIHKKQSDGSLMSY